MNQIYAVRHGQYSVHLTELGKHQAANAGVQLQELLEGKTPYIISSNALRAVETAEIIAEILHAPVQVSERIEVAGNKPEVVADLRDYLAQSLDGYKPDQVLIVVAHEPLLHILKGGSVAHGEVVPYNLADWKS